MRGDDARQVTWGTLAAWLLLGLVVWAVIGVVAWVGVKAWGAIL